MRTTSLLNLTLVVIGSCAETKAKGKRQKAKVITMNDERLKRRAPSSDDAETHDPIFSFLLFPFAFITLGPTQPDGLNRPLNSNRKFQANESDRHHLFCAPASG